MLAETLSSLRSLPQLSALFTRLGYRAADEPWADGALVVARWRAFKVVAVESSAPRDAARTLAHRFTFAGVRGLAVALGSEELALAAPTPGTPRSSKVLGVSLRHPGRVALAQLRDLRPRSDDTALAHAIRVADTLSREVAGDHFFRGFSVLLEEMAATVDQRHGEEDRRLTVLLSLTRMLFLYFIQAKGWLDGQPDYLRRRFDHDRGRGIAFHEHTLDPLFFGTLNRPPTERAADRAPGALPYLNGGLFERHPVEHRVGNPRFSNELWAQAFDQIFDRYRFCVREADEVDAVAPDTMGRVFERLMHSDERLRSGTFYTPESLVRQIVKAGLVTALPRSGDVSPETAERLVAGDSLPHDQRDRARRALHTLRILDPAAGSGAFLLGALEVLTELTLRVGEKDHDDQWVVRRRVLRDNLFGVDLNPIAVRLAELRLWLAVVADDPTTDVARITPLPNLDGVVRQGDSLLDPIAAARLSLGHAPNAARHLVQRMAAVRHSMFDARGRSTHRALTRLVRAEHRLARSMVEESLRAVRSRLQDLEQLTRGHDLFDRPVTLSAGQHRQVRRLRQDLEALTHARAALDDGALPFFSFEVHAPEVMARGGFHLVLGNPPWVRAERLTPTQRDRLSRRFRLWRARSGPGYAHLPDLSVAFLERFLELTAPGGTVAVLVPSKVTSAGYGEAARQYLVRETTVQYLHRVPDREAARFGATTYPLAVILRRSPPPSDHRVRLDFETTAHVRQAALRETGPWVLVSDRGARALAHLRAGGIPLRDIATPRLGVKTGADTVFVGRLVRVDGTVAVVRFGATDVALEAHLLRRVIRGRDVKRFRTRTSHVMVWGFDARGRPLPSLPDRTSAYLAGHRNTLERRADYRGGPLWTVFRTRRALAPYRIVWPDVARRPVGVMLEATDQTDAVPLNSCYIASVKSRTAALAITAVLNSSWFAALATVTANEARGGYRRINASVAAQLPVPHSERSLAELAALTERAQRSDDVTFHDVDTAVAEALHLSPSDRSELYKLGPPHRR